MNKSTQIMAVIALITLGLVIAGVIGYTKYSQNNTPDSSETTTTPVPITAADLRNSFLIAPDGYVFTNADIQNISNSKIKTILIDAGSAAYIEQTKQTFSNLVVENLSESGSYKKCEIGEAAVNPSTATVGILPAYSLNYLECGNDSIISNIYEPTCNISDVACQKILLEASGDETYIYLRDYPLTGLNTAPLLTAEQYSHAAIFTWQSDVSSLTQVAYSVEILNSDKKRIHATGKITSAGQGEWFVPTTAILSQELTVILRVWYKLGPTTFSVPQVIAKTFAYMEPTAAQTPQTTTKVAQMSWIPDWGMKAGITSVQNNPTKWSVISPVWFSPNKDGSLNKEQTFNSATLTSLLRQNHIKLVPTISLFDADILKSILKGNLDKHVTEITNVVVSNNFDGIDLDYESTYENDKELLLEFLSKLASRLHEKGKTLSFTAVPKIDDRRIYSFLPQTHQAQDWQAIGQIVDEFRIMAYDFTGQGSNVPGPLSPYYWDEVVIQYAISKMPAQKIVLALPLYSHAWPKPSSTNIAGTNNDKALSSGKLKNTVSLQHDDIAYIKSHSTYYREKYDSWNKEMRAEYKYNGVERIMYYLNKKAVNERLQLAQKYGIKGVCYWRIGGEDL